MTRHVKALGRSLRARIQAQIQRYAWQLARRHALPPSSDLATQPALRYALRWKVNETAVCSRVCYEM